MQLTSLWLCYSNFRALPPSWTALRSLRELLLVSPGPMNVAGALHPLGSWAQLTLLRIVGYDMSSTPGSLEHAYLVATGAEADHVAGQ